MAWGRLTAIPAQEADLPSVTIIIAARNEVHRIRPTLNALHRLVYPGPLEILTVFPNPATDYLRVKYETPDFDPYELRVFNALGQLVLRTDIRPMRFSQKLFSIDVSQWPHGAYYLAIQRAKERIVKPFLVSHY